MECKQVLHQKVVGMEQGHQRNGQSPEQSETRENLDNAFIYKWFCAKTEVGLDNVGSFQLKTFYDTF